MSDPIQMDDSFRIKETDQGVLELNGSGSGAAGRLVWDKDGAFTFEGDADSSAVVFLDFLNGHTMELKRAQDEVERLKAMITRIYRDLTNITTEVLYPREDHSSKVMIVDPNSPLGKVWRDDSPCCEAGQCTCGDKGGD